MLTLSDGRSELWQWDTNRKLTVDAECSQVHFSNKVFGRSIDVDVVDGAAIIPDILLQDDKELSTWVFVGTPENGYTKISKVFKVNRRNKPADYVFTPTDQTTLGELVERLDKIEESQDPDAIKNVVDDYLANNPVEIEETDPTVPEWAKQPEKPSYTAEEVGALPADTVIPEIPAIPAKLPNPYPLTFTGAVGATYDGSAPLTVNIPEGGGGTGGGDEWELITDITLTEVAKWLHFDTNAVGQAFTYKGLFLEVIPGTYTNGDGTETKNSYYKLRVGVNGNGTQLWQAYIVYMVNGTISNNATGKILISSDKSNCIYDAIATVDNGNTAKYDRVTLTENISPAVTIYNYDEPIHTVSLYVQYQNFSPNDKIKIYGKK